MLEACDASAHAVTLPLTCQTQTVSAIWFAKREHQMQRSKELRHVTIDAAASLSSREFPVDYGRVVGPSRPGRIHQDVALVEVADGENGLESTRITGVIGESAGGKPFSSVG